jgi:hypothetical protein
VGLFERLLREHEDERHAGILAGLAELALWRRPGSDTESIDGYRPPKRSAERMSLTEAETIEMARVGLLEWAEVGGEVWIRPAAVSVLAIREDGQAPA